MGSARRLLMRGWPFLVTTSLRRRRCLLSRDLFCLSVWFNGNCFPGFFFLLKRTRWISLRVLRKSLLYGSWKVIVFPRDALPEITFSWNEQYLFEIFVWFWLRLWDVLGFLDFGFCRRARCWSFWGLCGTLFHGSWKLQLSWPLRWPMEELVLHFIHFFSSVWLLRNPIGQEKKIGLECSNLFCFSDNNKTK